MIAATLRSSAAHLELLKVELIGELATATFDRLARSEGPARGIFPTDAADVYGQTVGRAHKRTGRSWLAESLLGLTCLSSHQDPARPPESG